MSNNILKDILDDRKQSAFADSLLIPRAVMSEFVRLNKFPADKHLRKIMKAENASMSALWGAAVAPFIVHRTNTGKESYDTLSAHLSDATWTIHLITGDEFPIIVLSCPAQDLIGNEEFNYTQVEVICGPMDHACANLFRDLEVNHKELSEDEAHLIATGYKGTYHLFGKDTLKDAVVIDQSQLVQIFRTKAAMNAAVLNRVLEIIDETILQENASLTKEEKRKLVTELYTFAMEEGLVPDQVSENLAHSMIRVVPQK